MSRKAAQLPPPPRAKDRSEASVKSRWPDWGSSLLAVLLFPLTLGLLAASYLVDMQFMGPQPEDSIESIIYLRAAGVTAVLMVGFVLDAGHVRLPVLKWLTKWLSSRWMRRLILVGTAIAILVPIQRLGDGFTQKREEEHAHAVALELLGDRVDGLEAFLHSLAPVGYHTEDRERHPFVNEVQGSASVVYRRDGGRNPEAEVRELHAMLLVGGAQLERVTCDEVKKYSPDRVVGRYNMLLYNLTGYAVSLRIDQDHAVLGGMLRMSGPIAPHVLTEEEQERLLDDMADCLDFLVGD